MIRNILKLLFLFTIIITVTAFQVLAKDSKDKKLSVAETMFISGHSDPKMVLNVYNNLELKDLLKKFKTS